MNEQNIFLDTADISPLSPSLIQHNTKTVNIFIDDGLPSVACALIGKKLEWKPVLWMMHEAQRLNEMQKVRVVICEGRLTENTKKLIRDILCSTTVEFIDVLLSGNFRFYVTSATMASTYIETSRDTPVYYSAGTMRLPRLLIAHWSQKHNIDNIGYPLMNNAEIKGLKDQISKLSDYDIEGYNNVAKRLYGDISSKEFDERQVEKLRGCRVNIVSEQPWFDHIEGFLCEKFSDAVANKCLPFFVGNRNDNEHIKEFGFEPYVGFDYSPLDNENFIDRWTGLLEKNTSALTNPKVNEEIYQLNRPIIDNNFDVLKSTDWKQKAKDEIESLPKSVKIFLRKMFFLKKIPDYH